MKIIASCLLIVASLAVASALAVRPTCPEWTLTDAALIADSLFTPNVLHYNKVDVMSGNPVGPYYSIDEAAGCRWRENSNFLCHLIIYKNSARTQQIGTGVMSSNNLIRNNDAHNTSGGFVQFSTTITLAASELPNPSNVNAPENRNFKSQNTMVYFQPKVVYPDAPAEPIANRIRNRSGRLFLTLWGSDGYNAASDSFDAATRGTGVDFEGELICPDNPPPVIPGCPCEDPVQIHSVSRGCIRPNVEIVRRSDGTCIELGFEESTVCPV
jgi:hypothetical protein